MAKKKTIEKNQKILDEFGIIILNNPEYQQIIQERFGVIEEFIDNSDSYEAMSEGISNLFDNLDTSRYESLLTRLMFVSYIFGFNTSNGNKT
jgi:phage gp29-like protein